MRAGLDLRRGVRSAVVGSALPYGYTVTTFATGQSVVHAHGSPSSGLLLLFALGAGGAYGLLRGMSRGVAADGHVQLGESTSLVRSGAIQGAAIVAAILAAAAVAHLPELEAWPAASFAATLLYLGVLAIELSLIERARTG
jgi:hypothetical protein